MSIYNKSGYRDKFNSQQLHIMDSREKSEKLRKQQSERQKVEVAKLKAEIDELRKFLTNEFVQEHHVEQGGTIEFNFRKYGTDERVKVVINNPENFEEAWKMIRREE